MPSLTFSKSYRGNLLLRALPPNERASLLAQCECVNLTLKNLLVVQDGPVEFVHFIEVGTVSMISNMRDGARIEVGLVGPEGMIGLPILLGVETSMVEAMVQVEGRALRLPADQFREALKASPALFALLLRYVDAFSSQATQSAVCNARHTVEQRLVRWILTTHDRVDGDTFLMTQEFMSMMLGVRRPGVTAAFGRLNRAGLVHHENGRVVILDRVGLEGICCECYANVERRYAWLSEEVEPASLPVLTIKDVEVSRVAQSASRIASSPIASDRGVFRLQYGRSRL